MTTWRLAAIAFRCGKCGAGYPRGAVQQEITQGGAAWKLLRGVCCAKGHPPADLPPLVPLGELQMEKLKLTP